MNRKEVKEQVEKLCLSIGKRVMEQYDYNVETNVPAGRLSEEEAAPNAMRSGLVGAITEMCKWSVGEATDLCADIMEDVNDSETAAYLRGLE